MFTKCKYIIIAFFLWQPLQVISYYNLLICSMTKKGIKCVYKLQPSTSSCQTTV